MSGLIQLKAVDVDFGAVHALAGVNLRVAGGERIALIGSNGSGKSTLLRVLHGLVTPARGSVLRDSAKRQAMLFQRPHMLRTSVLNNVALGLWIRGARWTLAKERALLALGRVGLAATGVCRGRRRSPHPQ
jgi:tungstate transport system ATP-binding protein